MSGGLYVSPVRCACAYEPSSAGTAAVEAEEADGEELTADGEELPAAADDAAADELPAAADEPPSGPMHPQSANKRESVSASASKGGRLLFVGLPVKSAGRREKTAPPCLRRPVRRCEYVNLGVFSMRPIIRE